MSSLVFIVVLAFTASASSELSTESAAVLEQYQTAYHNLGVNAKISVENSRASMAASLNSLTLAAESNSVLSSAVSALKNWIASNEELLASSVGGIDDNVADAQGQVLRTVNSINDELEAKLAEIQASVEGKDCAPKVQPQIEAVQASYPKEIGSCCANALNTSTNKVVAGMQEGFALLSDQISDAADKFLTCSNWFCVVSNTATGTLSHEKNIWAARAKIVLAGANAFINSKSTDQCDSKVLSKAKSSITELVKQANAC